MSEERKGELVVSVGGGPLAFAYGTGAASPEQFAEEVREAYDASGAAGLRVICVDPNTDVDITDLLHPHEKGFTEPDFQGNGWNAKYFADTDVPLNQVVAGMHKYCGSGSTNLNAGEWAEDTDPRYIEMAVTAIQQAIPGTNVSVVTYDKSVRTGMVDDRLQELTRTQYSKDLLG